MSQEVTQQVSNPFVDMNPSWLSVLSDMVDDFWDKDRHGELRGGWGYEEDEQQALFDMGTMIKDEARKRGVSW